MENLSLASNNQGTQSFIHRGDIEAKLLCQNQVPMDIKGVGYQDTEEEREDQGNVHA
jgi:hypothetical protein